MVSMSMMESLSQDAWLSAVLAYEIGNLVRVRAGYPDEPLEDFVVQLLSRAGSDPSVVPELGRWILGQTSLSLGPPSDEAIARFKLNAQASLARSSLN
jgi:hypothetical protein